MRRPIAQYRRIHPIYRFLSGLGLLATLACCTQAQTSKQLVGTPRTLPAPELWVSGYASRTVHRYGSANGEGSGDLGAIPGAQSIHQGPDGLLYICAEEDNEILRFRGRAFVDVFIGDDPKTAFDETGGLAGPTAAVFGADGNLYVASFDTDSILRYDGITGAFIDVFVPPGRGGLDGPDAGIVFGPDGALYVPSFYTHRVVKYSPASGFVLGNFIPSGRGGLRNPRVILFRPDGTLFVTSWGSNSILHYSSKGAFLGKVAGMNRPTGMAINPANGDLYVTSDSSNRVRQLNLISRRWVKTVIPSGTGGLSGAVYLTFVQLRR